MQGGRLFGGVKSEKLKVKSGYLQGGTVQKVERARIPPTVGVEYTRHRAQRCHLQLDALLENILYLQINQRTQPQA